MLTRRARVLAVLVGLAVLVFGVPEAAADDAGAPAPETSIVDESMPTFTDPATGTTVTPDQVAQALAESGNDAGAAVAAALAAGAVLLAVVIFALWLEAMRRYAEGIECIISLGGC